MEYQKIINFSDNTPNQPYKFRTKNWDEIYDDVCGTYSTNSQIKLEITMLKSSLSDYSDDYMLVEGTITVVRAGANKVVRVKYTENKQATFKNCALFTDLIIETKNTQLDKAKYFDVIILMYNLIEFSNNYSKTFDIYTNFLEMCQKIL